MIALPAISQQKDIGTVFKANFNQYSTLADVSLKWNQVGGTWIVSTGPDGTKCLRSNSGTDYLQSVSIRPNNNNIQEIKVAFDFKTVGSPGANDSAWVLLRDNTGELCQLQMDTGRTLDFRRFGAATVLATSAALTVNTWYRFVVRYYTADSGGRIHVLQNGTTIVDFTGDTLGGTPTGFVNFRLAGNAAGWKFKNVQCWQRFGI